MDGSLSWPRDLRLDWSHIQELAPDDARGLHGLFVLGDLVVEGGVLNADRDAGPALFVRGNLVAHNLVTGGGDIVVQRDVNVRDIVYGDYNHGTMEVRGHLYAGLVWMFDHAFGVRGEVHATRVVNDETEFPPHPEYDEEDDVAGLANTMLVTTVEDTDDFHRQLGKGRALLLPELRSTRTLAPAEFPETADAFLRFVQQRDLIDYSMVPRALRGDREFMMTLTRSHPMGYDCLNTADWHLQPDFMQAGAAAGNPNAAERIAREKAQNDN